MTPRSLRLLVVDDHPTIRRLVSLRLSTEPDLEVVGEAADGAAALELAEALRPDVVLLDLSMPVMDGLEALPRLRSLLPAARLVVLSGFDQVAIRERVSTLGADAYVEKGSSLDLLVEVIRGAAPADRVIDLRDPPARSDDLARDGHATPASRVHLAQDHREAPDRADGSTD